MVLMRAMSRRTWRTRAVFSNCPLARWKRRLNASFFSSSSWVLSSSGVLPRSSSDLISGPLAFAQARHEPGLDRQLGGRQLEGALGQVGRHAVDLEHDPARVHADHPVFRRALA